MKGRALPVADLAVKVLAVGLALYPLIDPAASHFRGKAMGVRAVTYPWAAVAIPALWWFKGRPRPYPFIADIALVTPFLLDAAGNVLGLFAVPGFDAIPHLLGWFCLAVAFGLAVAPIVRSRWTVFGLCVGLGATLDVAWEIGEFLLQRSGSSGLQLTYENTIQDLGMSLLGSLIGAVAIVSAGWPATSSPRQVFGWSHA